MRLFLSCSCGHVFSLTEGAGACGAICPSCHAEGTREEVARLVPPGSALGVRQVAVLSALSMLTILIAFVGYWMQAEPYKKVFADIGRSLPAMSNLMMHRELMGPVYGSLAVGCLYVFLLSRESSKRGQRIGTWPARALCILLLSALILDALVQEAFQRPFLDLMRSLH